MSLLQVEDVVAGFGATTVLHGLSYEVEQGEIAGIFGLNVQDLGAQQTGMSVDAFKQKLVAAGR